MIKKISLFVFKNYPLLFLLDALISLINDVIVYFIPFNELTLIRSSLAQIVLYGGIFYIYYLFFIETKNKHKYLLMPLCSMAASAAGIWMLSDLIANSSIFEFLAFQSDLHKIAKKHPAYLIYQIMIDVVQLGLGVFVLNVFNKDTYSFKEKVPGFFLPALASFFYSCYLFVVSLTALPVILISGTGNFLDIEGDNIISVERIYKKNETLLHLVPMIHVGSETFYKEVSKVEGKKKTLFLLEGVQDEKKLLDSMNYGKLASKAGLDLQTDHFMPAAPKELENNVTIKLADVDVNEFNPKTRAFLKRVSEQMNEGSLFEILFMDSEEFTREETGTLMVDLIDRRNAKLLTELKLNENKFEEIYVPWGAAHMPQIEKEILSSGYKLIGTKERSIISLRSIISKISARKNQAPDL